jgi:histidine triad (HIT) family protein
VYFVTFVVIFLEIKKMSPCVFCDILAEIIPANFVYRDELCAAFMDIRPINSGHVLVVPNSHATQLAELDEAAAGRLLRAAQKVDSALRASGLKCEGVNLFLADGRPAGQEVMHVHLHIIPRFRGDGHHLRFSPEYFKPTPAAELEKNSDLIRAHMEGKS